MRVFGSFACYTYVPRVSEWESLVLLLATPTSPEWVNERNESLWFFSLLHLRPQSEWMRVFGSFACYTYVPRVSEWESLVLVLATFTSPEWVNESLWFFCLLHLRPQSEWIRVFGSFACYTCVPRVSEWESLVLLLATPTSPEWVNERNESLWFFSLLHLRPQSEWMRVFGSFACYTYVPRVNEWESLILSLATLTSPEWVNESLWFLCLLHLRPQSEWMRVFGSFACYIYVPRVSEWESLVLLLATPTSPEWVNERNESLWFFSLLHLRPQSEWMRVFGSFACYTYVPRVSEWESLVLVLATFTSPEWVNESLRLFRLLHLRPQSEWIRVFGSFACYTCVPRVSEWESLVLSLATLTSPERVNESLWFFCLLHLRPQSEWMRGMRVFGSLACYTYVPRVSEWESLVLSLATLTSPEWMNESLWFFRLLHLRPQSEWMRVFGSCACYIYVPRVSEWESLVLSLATFTSPEWMNESLWFFRLLHLRPQSEWMRVFGSCACYIYVPRVSEWESLVLSLATFTSPEWVNESLWFFSLLHLRPQSEWMRVFGSFACYTYVPRVNEWESLILSLATLTSPEWVNESLWFLCLLHLRPQSEWMRVFGSFACYTYVPRVSEWESLVLSLATLTSPEWVNESVWFLCLLHLRPQSEWMRVFGSFACYTCVPRAIE